MSESKNPGSPESQAIKPAALSITIQSWATPVLAVIMLVLGLVGGYYARPYLTGEAALPGEAATPESAAAPSAATPNPEEIAARQQALMKSIVERTRHFKGNPDAPVTVIEFSDFQ
jgi:hypothetical protein